MANTLIKDALPDDGSGGGNPMRPPSGGGAGGGGAGGGGAGGGGAGGSTIQLGTPGTPCYDATLTRLTELYPTYSITYSTSGGSFCLVSPDGAETHYVKSLCTSGYIELDYYLTVQAPTGA